MKETILSLINSRFSFFGFILLGLTPNAQITIFDHFTYSGINDSQLPILNKWKNIIGKKYK